MHSKDTSVHSSHIGVHFLCARKVDEAKAFVTSSIWLFLVCKYGGTGNI